MHAPEKWTQRVGGLTAVPRLLRDYRVSAAEILTAAGLAPDVLDDAENRLPYASAATLLNECVRVTGCPHFGLLVGAAWHLRDAGLPGRLARRCDRLATALETLTAYMRLNNQVAAAYFRRSDAGGELGYAVFQPRVTHLAVAYDVAMGTGVVQIRDLLGNPRWRPQEVLLPRSAPPDVGAYKRHFGCPIRFDADRAALLIAPGDVDQPLPSADAQRLEQLRAQAEALLGDQFLLRVYESLRLLLLQGSADSASVASRLSIHRRTLIRRLAQRGTSFQEILDQVRYDVARQMLRETNRSVTEVGAALGFSESSGFTHAFHRWSGVSPSAWRLQASGD
jgi:AraC-like DNA-binding protein